MQKTELCATSGTITPEKDLLQRYGRLLDTVEKPTIKFHTNIGATSLAILKMCADFLERNNLEENKDIIELLYHVQEIFPIEEMSFLDEVYQI